MKTVIVTRPREEGAPFAERLAARGMTAILSPVLEIRLIDIAGELGGADALAFTSQNGLKSYLASHGRTHLPVFAVGAATAAAARAAGFAEVSSAEGDGAALADLIARRLTPDAAILHVAGRDEAFNLAGALKARGFPARRAVGYAAEAAGSLSAEAITALAAPTGALWVALFSARSARVFLDLAGRAGVGEKRRGVGAACLSRTIAEAAGPGWRETRIAARPSAAALIEAIEKD
jgi:uroporphyrinogen-III synthase